MGGGNEADGSHIFPFSSARVYLFSAGLKTTCGQLGLAVFLAAVSTVLSVIYVQVVSSMLTFNQALHFALCLREEFLLVMNDY